MTAPEPQAIRDDPQELQRAIRDLLAVSMVPAIWLTYNAREIAESLTELLVRMLGLEFAYLSLWWPETRQQLDVAHTTGRNSTDITPAVREALSAWLTRPPHEVIAIPNPLGDSLVRVAFLPISTGPDAVIVAASRRDDFPRSSERVTLRVAANQATIAIRRWQAEQELHDLNETLEQRVAAEVERRTKIEEDFRQSQKMEVLGQLAGGMAHDFNNLLMVITGNLELLQERAGVDQKLAQFVEPAMTAALRGAELTHHLLAFARHQPLDAKAFDVNKQISKTLTLFRRTLGEQIDIQTALALDLWPAFADEVQFESALINLAINARDAMNGNGRLVIESANVHIDGNARESGRSPPGDYVMIAVSDNGTGMPPEVQARAFEPFFTTKQPGKGTGLGLSMVYGFVQQSGGHVEISSTLGSGTTVRLYLPRAPEGKAPTQDTHLVRPPMARPGECILVVEDNPDVRQLTVMQLRELGYRVVEAANGPAAVDILARGERVDLLFTDVLMPGGMTGGELASVARTMRPRLRVLVTSGFAGLMGSGQRSADFVHVLSKPYRKAELGIKVRAVLDDAD